MKFHIYQDKRGEWRWRLKARNGRIVADSGEGYANQGNAVRAVRVTMVGIDQMPYRDPTIIVEKPNVD